MGAEVGIIVPSYNQGTYIERALQSIMANKRNADIDIAVMDGGSHDDSVQIIRKYEKDIRVWRSEPDGGQAAAINKGIGYMPDCQYYMWLNSDDVYESDTVIRDILEFARNGKYDVCYGKSHFIDENDNVIGEYPVEEFSEKNLGRRCYLSQPSVMFSRKAYEMTGPINESLKMCLDYEYWIRLAPKYTFGYIEKYIGATRMYGGTKTANMQQTHLAEAINILNEYYGNVPMEWIVTKILADHPDSLLRYIPKRVLMVIMRPLKKKVLRQVL